MNIRLDAVNVSSAVRKTVRSKLVDFQFTNANAKSVIRSTLKNGNKTSKQSKLISANQKEEAASVNPCQNTVLIELFLPGSSF